MAATCTSRQAELLHYLERYIVDHDGVAPSFEEMKEHMGLSAKSGGHRLLAALEERGKIRRIANRARAIEVVEEDPFAGISSAQMVEELKRRGVVL